MWFGYFLQQLVGCKEMGEQVMKAVESQIPAAVWFHIAVRIHDRVAVIQAVTPSTRANALVEWAHGYAFLRKTIEKQQFCMPFYLWSLF